MTRLPRYLFPLFALLLLWLFYRHTAPLPEFSPLPPELRGWRARMEADRWITVEGRVGQ